MSSSEENGAISGTLDGQYHTEGQDNNNLSSVLRQEAFTFRINSEDISIPSRKLKSSSAVSQN